MSREAAKVLGIVWAGLLAAPGSVRPVQAQANKPPATPSLVSPEHAAVGVGLTPTLEASSFSDPDGDGHASSHWQVSGSANFIELIWDTGESYPASTHEAVPPGELVYGTTWYWRVRYKDARGAWSAWSAARIFNPGVFADSDHDDDVDMEDFGLLQRCLTGRRVRQDDPACQAALIDGNDYVDQDDVSLFLSCLMGAGIDAPPSCRRYVATPGFSPPSGTRFVGSVDVAISTATPDAEIRYTTDGSEPTRRNGAVYTGPVHLTDSTTIKAVASAGLADSEVGSATFTVVASTPTFDPTDGTEFVGSVDVTISVATPGAEIHYTTDGTDPTTSTGTLYTEPVQLTATTTIKAIACAEGLAESDIGSATFTALVDAPTFSPPDGEGFLATLQVSISTATPAVEIRYTTDGTLPTRSQGTVYTGPIVLGHTTSIKAIAYAEGMGDSPVVSATFWKGPWRPLDSGVGGALGEYPNVYALTVLNGDLIVGGRYVTAGGKPAGGTARWDGDVWWPVGSGIGGAIYPEVRAMTVHDGALIVGGAFTTAGGVPANHIARWDGALWQPLGGGMDNGVVALTVYDGDLIAGGHFSMAGGSTVHSIARWDGASWQPLGSGLRPGVSALAVYDGELIAGGHFLTIGEAYINYIARWDGASWQPLGSGMDGWVHALTVHNGELIAGGTFYRAGGKVCHRVARWNGSSWQELGTGLADPVSALTVHNGELIAGGSFSRTVSGVAVNYIARWDGQSWQPLDGGMNSTVNALTVCNGELIAAGFFTTAGGRPVNRIARYVTAPEPNVAATPAFDPPSGTVFVGSADVTISSATPGAQIRYTSDGTVPSSSHGTVYTGPVHLTATTTIKATAYADGLTDSRMRSGTFTLATVSTPTFSPPNGTSFIGSIDVAIASATEGAEIRYTLDGTDPTASTGTVYTGAVHLTGPATIKAIGCAAGMIDSAVASATYTFVRVASPTFDPPPGTKFIAALDVSIACPTSGAEIRYTTDGTTPTRSTGTVYTGPVHLMAPTVVRAIAWVDGMADSAVASATYPFVQVSPPTFSPGNGAGFIGSLDVTISTATAGAAIRYTTDGIEPSRSTGTLYTGPVQLTQATTIKAIAYLDGMADSQIVSARFLDDGIWQQVGEVNRAVNALTLYNGELIAGGQFTIAGGRTVNCIAKWNGSYWEPLGSGMAGNWPWVLALTVYSGELVAGGYFTAAGGTPASHIARWNGSSWQPLGGGTNQGVFALAVHNGELIAGGDFETAGGTPANRIARWNGESWQPLGTGMTGDVQSLTVYNGELIAGGLFFNAGGTRAGCIASWNGSSWQALGSGMNNAVIALTVYRGELIAAGEFSTADGAPANHIARWDGAGWQALGDGLSGRAFALTVHDDALIAGGGFGLAGGRIINDIARWDGESWGALGSGVGAGVVALTIHDDLLIVGGDFTSAGGRQIRNIARWVPAPGQ